MVPQLSRCILTGYSFGKNVNFEEWGGDTVTYTFPSVGRVRISEELLLKYMDSDQYNHPVLAGICRNQFEANEEASLLSIDFIQNKIKNFNYPKEFKEKARHFLKYIYNKGGNEYKKFDLFSNKDYTICFAESPDDFNRILEYLNKIYWIEWGDKYALGGEHVHYRRLQLTTSGIEEVEKELPKVPMIGLVSQDITTGNPSTDDKINHAKDIFFQEPQTLERMRSACEVLSFILEPLRLNKELEKCFFKQDISDFFNIINNFDIRHNKENTKYIHHPEQLEWIFYSLLNTISTYTKLIKRLSP